MRRLSLLLAAVALLSAAADAAAAPMYPDLRTLPPRDLRFDRTDVSLEGTGDVHNVLRFSNTVTNQGEGKLLLRGTFDPADTSTAPAVQHIYDASGADVEDHTVGTYIWHPAHQHYHFADWGRYELWTRAGWDAWLAAGRPTTMAPDIAGSKTTSCVMDEEFISTLPATPWPGVFPGSGCGLDSNDVMTQGLSAGWGDTYDYYRQEQWIDLGQGHLADGPYVLRSIADPFDHIYESPGKTDQGREGAAANEGLTFFSVAGGQLVEGDPPSGTVWIDGVDATTSSSQVTVRVVGRDDIAGVTDVRVSNDGASWSTYPYGGQGSTPMVITWDLADDRYGGATAGGTRSVYAEFRDASGKWSAPVTDTIDWTGGDGPAAPQPGSDYGATVLDDAPLSFWRLGETSGATARDERDRNPGTDGGGPALGAAGLLAADPDRAASFDGVDDRVSTAGDGMAPPTAFALEAWIRPAALPPDGRFASIATRPEAYSLQLNGPRLEWTVIDGLGARHRLQAPAGAIAPGSAYQVAGTYDGVTQRLYVDGLEVARTALNVAAGGGTGFFIGSWSGGQEFFAGTIDEVAYYDHVLTGLQVKKHHDVGIATAVGLARPTGLSARAGRTSVDLSWADNARNETGYAVERAASSSFAGAARIDLPAGATAHTDAGLTPQTTYWYRVRAVGAGDASAWSAAVSATTGAAAAPDAAAAAAARSASYAAAVLGDRPLSYWRFEETRGTVAHDQRHANTGRLRGGTRLGVAGLLRGAGHALRLDGRRADVALPSRASLALGRAFTLEAWVRPAFLPARGSLASILAKPEAYALELRGPRLELVVIGGGRRLRLAAPAGTIVAGRRYHVVATADGARARLYVDGRLVASRGLRTTPSATRYGLSIGDWGGRGENLGGDVDEVAVYRHALTGAQVRAHFAAGGSPAPGRGNGARARRTRPAQRLTRR